MGIGKGKAMQANRIQGVQMESFYWKKAGLLAKALTERMGLAYNTDMRFEGSVFQFFVYPSRKRFRTAFSEWADKERLEGNLEELAEDWSKRAKELYERG